MPRPRKGTNEDTAAVPVFPPSLIGTLDPSRPRSAQVYGLMRRAIIEMLLPPGSAINERQICEELSVSRTPLREALLKLQDQLLVTIIPNNGTYVSKIDLETVFEGHLVRHALEMRLVQLAAVRMTAESERRLDFNMYQQRRLVGDRDYQSFYDLDENFHSLIAEIGASSRVWPVVHSAKAQLDRIRRLAFPMPSHLDVILGEHEEITTGLRLRDPDRAAAAMALHLDRVFESARRLIAEKRDLFELNAGAKLETYSALLLQKNAS